jgi:AcrR family transcriptional regulator
MVQPDTQTDTKRDPNVEAARDTEEAGPATPRDAFLAARRQEILDAARRAFVANGFDATSMQRIAQESGVSAGNIYRYFDSKEALIGAVIEGCDGETRTMFADATASTSTPNEALTAIGDQVWATIGTEESREQSMLNLEALLVAARNSDVGDVAKQTAQTVISGLTELVEGAQSDGEIDDDFEASSFATMLYALVLGMQQLQLQLGDEVDAMAVWATQERLLAPSVHVQEPFARRNDAEGART